MRGWRLWLFGVADSQDHGEATITDLSPRLKWEWCVERSGRHTK